MRHTNGDGRGREGGGDGWRRRRCVVTVVQRGPLHNWPTSKVGHLQELGYPVAMVVAVWTYAGMMANLTLTVNDGQLDLAAVAAAGAPETLDIR